jgi:hypothetical protein
MDSEPTCHSGSGAQSDQVRVIPAARITRRALLGGASTAMAAAAAAWIAPEIFIAKPAAGATLSGVSPATGGEVATGAGSTSPGSFPTTASEPTVGIKSETSSGVLSGLANTGLNLERGAQLGAALVAGGWAMQHWASRQQARATHARLRAYEAGRSDPTA